MNQHDRKQLEIAHLKLDDMRQDLVDLKNDMEKAHQKTDESLSFIKENLFNPHEGLWAETKENTRFRENSQKWRGIIGVGFVGLVIEKVWSLFT
jgi:t-SNARE complex subunit (syntaxin)|tara:strand:+ start:104 stop:385 length:282 start_codon:yes stop_codon:yes gene_type:complete